MKIMVFDVAAESGGATSILYDFYDEIKAMQSNEYQWIFILSVLNLDETENIKVMRFPWIKKSWIHRLFFEYVICPILLRKYNVNRLVSLQNLTIPFTKTEQILYVHNSIPFVEYKFRFFSDFKMWIYQNIIAKLIVSSIKKASLVIVQTKWMKKAIQNRLNGNNAEIIVSYPKVIRNDHINSKLSVKNNVFFYPCSEFKYKNHTIIKDASIILSHEGITDYKVLLTLDGNESKYIEDFKSNVEALNLPFYFIGKIPRTEVFDFYESSVLLFPSFVETFGLPLLEAKIHNGLILSSNCEFAKEVLNDYENVHFFDPFKASELSDLMIKSIHGNITQKIACNATTLNSRSLVNIVTSGVLK